MYNIGRQGQPRQVEERGVQDSNWHRGQPRQNRALDSIGRLGQLIGSREVQRLDGVLNRLVNDGPERLAYDGEGACK
jgi:hypothetical protein